MISQVIVIPEELNKHKDFSIKISENNDRIYSHIEYLKNLVEHLYELYRKMSKSILKITEQHQKKMTNMNDATALSILNFIKGIHKIYQNIRDQISNTTVNLNKKNQKVSKTRKDIIHEKLVKINQLFLLYFEKVQKYNQTEEQYQQDCQYFKNIENDEIKFYSTKQNRNMAGKLQKAKLKIQQSLEQTYSIKIELKSGLNELRLSLKQFFQMLSNNADDDRKLLISVRKKLKQTKIFNQTIIEEVNSQAEESVKHQQPTQKVLMQQSFAKNEALLEQFQGAFSSLNQDVTIFQDRQDMIKNIQSQEIGIQLFCQFLNYFQKQIIQAAQMIDKMRSTKDFQKFIDNKYQINQILTTDMAENTQAIKNQISDLKQIIQSIKALLDKKKVINELKKYRAIKCQKFIVQTQQLAQLQKKRKNDEQSRKRYKDQKQKFAKGHLQLMRRFREMIQDTFRQINQKFKFQRNTEAEIKKRKNQFVKKKYYSLLMLTFFINKEEPPKFQTNPYLKNYEKYLTQQHLKKVGLAVQGGETESDLKKKGWGCCGMVAIGARTPKNNYIDEYNCALKNGLVLVQGKMKLHQNYLKFISSFNAKTIFGQTNIRIPKWDIQSIEKRYVLLSLVVTIVTTRGSISFTSFLSDPYDKLKQIYESRQNRSPTSRYYQSKNVIPQKFEKVQNTIQKLTDKTANQTYQHNPKSPRQNSKNLLLQLQQKFQCQIPVFIDKELIIFESLSTYLSQSKRQLSISVQYHLISNVNTINANGHIKNVQINSTANQNMNKEKKYFFQIKIIHNKNSQIEYKFVHQKSMENDQIKRRLQKMATQIINTKMNVNKSAPTQIGQVQSGLTSSGHTQSGLISSGHTQKQRKSLFNDEQHQMKDFIDQRKNIALQKQQRKQSQKMSLSSYSFIQRKQNNQFQFDKDPSFVYVKQPSVGQTGNHSFDYVPDLQIFKNMQSQKKILVDDENGNIKLQKKKSNSMNNSRNNSRQHTLSRQQIDDYLNSIDQKKIKKNLFNSKASKKGSGKGKQQHRVTTNRGDNFSHQSKNSLTQQKSDLINNSILNKNNLLAFLVIIIGLNLFVSIFK